MKLKIMITEENLVEDIVTISENNKIIEVEDINNY